MNGGPNVRIALLQPEYKQADRRFNTLAAEKLLKQASEMGAHVAALSDPKTLKPELVALNGASLSGDSIVTLCYGDEECKFATDVDASENTCAGASYCDAILSASCAGPWTETGHVAPAQTGLSIPVIETAYVGMENQGKCVTSHSGGAGIWLDGQRVAGLNENFEPAVDVFGLNHEKAANEHADIEQADILDALVYSIRAFDSDVLGNAPWIIGLSGGLDSSVVAGLLTLAVGAKNVRAYNLATRFNSAETKSAASHLASSLGISLRSGTIEPLVEETMHVAEDYGYPRSALEGLVGENVQARIRGHMLSTFAAIEGGVVVNNGNKVEAALGYATLYGDAIGALAPIGDLAKVKLFSLERTINERFGRDVIPNALLPRETDEGYEWELMPSAELSDGQRDPMKWFYHDWLVEQLKSCADETLEDLLAHYAKNKFVDTEIAKWIAFYGLDDPNTFVEDFEWVVRSMKRAAFKRIQSPPVVKVSGDSAIEEIQGAWHTSERYKDLRRCILQA